MHFGFRGKSGKRHRVEVNDRRLAGVVKRCRDLPGQKLFQYVNGDGRRQTIGSADVNAYLKRVTGEALTAKDFRTWSGTVLAALALSELPRPGSKAQAERHVRTAVDAVAGMLGNTRSVCRKSYIHPAVLDAYVDGTLARAMRQRRQGGVLRRSEGAVLAVIGRSWRSGARRGRARMPVRRVRSSRAIPPRPA